MDKWHLTITCWKADCGFPIRLTMGGANPNWGRAPDGSMLVICPKCEAQSSAKTVAGRVFRPAGKEKA
jgi:hypothetical protein